MRIGLFGGTFNPIHFGHIHLAEQIYNALQLDEVWFLVTPQNPWKRNDVLMPDEKRLEMVRMALEGKEGLVASDYEFKLEKPSYTYLTLRHLREDYPDDDFVLLIGADNWVKFHEWREWEEILEHHKIAVYPREGSSIDMTDIPENVTIVNTELYPYSSTDIRARISKGESIQGMVPTCIIEMLCKQ